MSRVQSPADVFEHLSVRTEKLQDKFVDLEVLLLGDRHLTKR